MNSESSKEGGQNGLESPLRHSSIATTQNEEQHSHHRSRSSKGSEPFEKWEQEEMEKLLLQLNGQLGMYRWSDSLTVEVYFGNVAVLYPNHFLESEDTANNFLFNADRLVIVLWCALDSYD
jgi:phospholipase D1/2